MAKKIIISKNLYQGIRTTASGQVNRLTKCFYQAKFFNSRSCIRKLANIAIAELADTVKQTKFDIITAPNNVVNKTNLAKEIAKLVGKKYGITYRELFKNSNQKLNTDPAKIKAKKILNIDDVIYTGKTIKGMWHLLRTAGVNTVVFYAPLKSHSFKAK